MSYLEDLERLGRLREQKVLSDAEFEAEKTRLLEAQRPRPSAAAEASFNRNRMVIGGAAVVALIVTTGIYFGVTSAGSAAAPEPPATRVAAPSIPADVRLSSILQFTVPSQCAPGDNLQILVDDLRSLEPGTAAPTLTLPDGGGTVHPRVHRVTLKDQQAAIISELTAPGSLAGLKVTALRTSRFDGSNLYTTQLRFAEAPDKVLRVLNGEGFDLPRIGELKSVDLEDGALMLGVEGLAGGSALTCART